MEPMTMMALGSLAGGAMGGIGNIIGGATADMTPSQGDLVAVSSDPYANTMMGALEFDAATGLGFGDATRIAGPLRDVANRLQALPVDNRQKRRAAIGLAAIARYPDLDPAEALTRFAAERGEAGIGAGHGEILQTTLNVMNRLGYDRQALQDLGRREAIFNEQRQGLLDQGFGGIQTDIVLDRARMAQQMGQLGIQATDYAVGGAVTPLQQNFIDRRNRAIDRDEETALLRAANLGLRPGTIERDFADLRANTEMAAFADTIQAAAGLQQLFSGQRAPAERTTELGVTTSQNALNTAANQANAANQITAQGTQAEGAALSTGIAQGLGEFGSSLTNLANLGILNEMGAFGAPAAQTTAPVTQSGTTVMGPGSLPAPGSFQVTGSPYISLGGR
jgi:hypothetical protein